MSQGENIDAYRRRHGEVHAAVDKRMGKTLGKFLRELYRSRLRADYEPDFLGVTYAGNLETARIDAWKLLNRAKQNFYWIYNESRKAL